MLISIKLSLPKPPKYVNHDYTFKPDSISQPARHPRIQLGSAVVYRVENGRCTAPPPHARPDFPTVYLTVADTATEQQLADCLRYANEQLKQWTETEFSTGKLPSPVQVANKLKELLRSLKPWFKLTDSQIAESQNHVTFLSAVPLSKLALQSPPARKPKNSPGFNRRQHKIASQVAHLEAAGKQAKREYSTPIRHKHLPVPPPQPAELQPHHVGVSLATGEWVNTGRREEFDLDAELAKAAVNREYRSR